MRLDKEKLLALKAELDEINACDLSEIEFYEDGKRVEISAESIEAWKYIGLSNLYFFLDELWNNS